MIEFTFHRTSGTALVHVGHCIHCIVINACYVDVLLPDFVRHACIMIHGPRIDPCPAENFPTEGSSNGVSVKGI